MKGKLSFVLFIVVVSSFMLPATLLAGIIKGVIRDAAGVTLPFATVYIQGSTVGTSANAQGEYQLNIDAGTHKVVCQYMGFKQSIYTVTIKGSETVTHNFTMLDQHLEMKEVVIRNEDPAYAIIRKAIERRRFHLQQVRSFQADIYLKGVLRNRQIPDFGAIKALGGKGNSKAEISRDLGMDTNGKAVLYLCEEKADYYAQGNKERTVVRSVRESGNPHGLGFAEVPSVVSFYQNNIDLFSNVNPRGFISPISENALNYYHYHYEGEFKQDGYTINKIRVIPKRPFEPLFSGTIYIVDNDWAIHSLSMWLTKKSNLNFFDSIRIDEVFLPMGNDNWVVKSQVLYPTIKILGFDIAGYFVTVYDKQKVNQAIPDTIFGTRIVSVYDKNANKKDTSYWTDVRPVPLEADESKDYIVKDSINKHDEDPRYLDSLRRKSNKITAGEVILTGISVRTKKDKNTFRINPLLPIMDGAEGMVNYNTVEGFNVAPRVWWDHTVDTNKTISAKVATRYGFSNTHFNAIGRLAYRQDAKAWRGRWWRIGGEGGKYVFQYDPKNPVPEFYNTISALFYRKNFLKLYERYEGALFFDQSLGNGFRWSVKGEFQHRLPLQNTADFTFARKETGGFTDNLPNELRGYKWEEHNAALASLAVSYQPGYTYTQYPDYLMPHGSSWPVFTFEYEKGIKGLLDSKVDFDKWRFSIRDNMHLKMLGTLSYNLAAGGFLNDRYVSLPDLMHPYANQIIAAAPYLRSFQLMPYYLFSNTEHIYGEAHIEYNLKGLLTNKIPLLRQAQWYLVAGNNTFYARQNYYYTEAFIGIDNLGFKLYRLFRVDFIESWDSFRGATTGIRIGMSTSGVRIGGRRETGEEW